MLTQITGIFYLSQVGLLGVLIGSGCVCAAQTRQEANRIHLQITQIPYLWISLFYFITKYQHTYLAAESDNEMRQIVHAFRAGHVCSACSICAIKSWWMEAYCVPFSRLYKNRGANILWPGCKYARRWWFHDWIDLRNAPDLRPGLSNPEWGCYLCVWSCRLIDISVHAWLEPKSFFLKVGDRDIWPLCKSHACEEFSHAFSIPQ
jgi:hypothetical protein